MSKKQKNPLYVVKGDSVEPANNILDLLVKKFNLAPFFDVIIKIMQMLLENIKSYAALELAIGFFDDFMKRIQLFKNYSII
jgi:hypothetical protein